MSETTKPAPPSRPTVWGNMPAQIKMLHITTRQLTGGWLAEAFASDSASDIHLEEAVGEAAALAQLREEVFDAVLVAHEPGSLDALELVEGLRAGGSEEPMIVLGVVPSAEMAALCYEVGADAYCCIDETSTRSLLWTFARAMERYRLVRENRMLLQAERQRLAQEHQEAERLLTEQRSLIEKLQSPCTDDPHDTSPRPVLPEALVKHYREMLRAYVVMGAGNLSEEMRQLAALLVEANVTAHRAMELHISVLEELIRGLGNRSARHVMNRADLLALEMMAHLADGYRQQDDESGHPPRQPPPPGFPMTSRGTSSASPAA